MVKARIYILIAILAMAITTKAYAIDSYNIYDVAEVLSIESTELISQYSRDIHNELGIDIVISTVLESKGHTAKEIATLLAKKLDLSGQDRKSVIISLATDIREVYVFVSAGLRLQLPDNKTELIIKGYGVPYYTNDEFDVGTVELFKAIYSFLVNGNDKLEPLTDLPDKVLNTNRIGDILVAGGVLVFLLSIAAMLTSNARGTNSSNHRYNDYTYYDSGSGSSGDGGAGSSF